MFSITGQTLVITLNNLGDSSGAGTDVPANQLTGLFFDLPYGVTLTPVSATIDAGTLLQGNTCNPGPCNSSTTNVGGEFAYKTSGSLPGGADRGISSTGLNIFGQPNFGGVSLDNPDAVDGKNFSIVAPVNNANAFNPNGGLASEPLIEAMVEFQLTISTITGDTITAADLSHVSFQYGTSLSEPNIPGLPGDPGGGTVPEPATALLAMLGATFAVRRHLRTRVRS
jgi:hypothetical protein